MEECFVASDVEVELFSQVGIKGVSDSTCTEDILAEETATKGIISQPVQVAARKRYLGISYWKHKKKRLKTERKNAH